MRVVLPKIGRKSRLTAVNTGMWCRQFSRSFIKAPIGAFLFEIYPIIFIMTRKIFLLVFLLFVGCDIDEDIPEHPTGLRGYFTLANGNPRIQITWDESESDDVSEYHIFRAAGLGNFFDLLSTVGSSDSTFTDTTIIWQESFGYKIRAKDQSTNTGEFSDSIFIFGGGGQRGGHQRERGGGQEGSQHSATVRHSSHLRHRSRPEEFHRPADGTPGWPMKFHRPPTRFVGRPMKLPVEGRRPGPGGDAGRGWARSYT